MSHREEKIFYFNGSKGRSLLGFLHSPISPKTNIGIVYCHPFADEQTLSHRIVVNTARTFAELGIPVLRFDMSGCGDSEGNLEEVLISDWKEDITRAIKILKNKTDVKDYALWGLRLGAGLALLHEERYKEASFMILWQPVINFSEYIKRFVRRESTLQISENIKTTSAASFNNELEEKGVVDIIGYPISKKLYENFLEIDNKPLKLSQVCNILLCSISLMDRPSFSVKRYYENFKSMGVNVQFSHFKVEPFWNQYWRWYCQEVTDATARWLKNQVCG